MGWGAGHLRKARLPDKTCRMAVRIGIDTGVRLSAELARDSFRRKKPPIIVPGRRHLGAAGPNGEQVGVAEALGIIEDGDDAAIGAHHRRMLGIGPSELRERRVAVQDQIDRSLPLPWIPHFRGVGGNRQRLDLRWVLKIASDHDRDAALALDVRIFLAGLETMK